MMSFTQQRTQSRLALSLITCAILYTGIVYNRVKSKVTPSTEKKVSTQRPLSNEEQEKIDVALEKAIMYAHDVGKWLEDLFDTENNIPYIEHVKHLKETVINIEQNFVMPLNPDENAHPAMITAHHVALLLLDKVESTYEVLKSYHGSTFPYGLGWALQKVLNSSSDQAKFNTALQELHTQLEVATPELNAKLNDFKGVIKLYNERINNKSLRTLTNGLWHRLACKEEKVK